MIRSFGAPAVLLGASVCLSACGGGGQPPFRIESAYDTAVIQTDMNVCNAMYTVHRDGSAQRVTQTCGGGTVTETLPPTIVSTLFSDLQAAQPLSALPACPSVDTSIAVAWNGEQSRNISGPCIGTNPAEQTLAQQVSVVVTAFEPVP